MINRNASFSSLFATTIHTVFRLSPTGLSGTNEIFLQPVWLLCLLIDFLINTFILFSFSFTYREPQQIEYGIQEEHLQLQEDSDGGGSTSSGAGGDRGYADDLIQETGKSSGGQQKRGGLVVDDKKMRRQIANSNERRRMQSINAGFQSLRNQLPHHEGEKLSKVGIAT